MRFNPFNRLRTLEALEVRNMLVATPAMLADLNQSPYSSYPDNLLVIDDTLFFSTSDGAIWKSDGSEVGTNKIADVPPRLSPHSVDQFIEFQDRLYFVSDTYELWQTDGTTAGTSLVAEFSEGSEIAKIDSVAPAGDVLIASVTHFGSRTVSLWSVRVSSEEIETTKLLSQDRQGSRDIGPLSTVGDTVYFHFKEAPNATEALWSTDGTVSGTRRVVHHSDLGTAATLEGEFPQRNGMALYVDGASSFDASLWYYDDALGALNQLNPSSTVFEDIGWVDATSNGITYFVVTRQQRFELWKSNGQSEDATRVAQLGSGVGQINDSLHLVVGNRVFFNARIGETEGIIVTDGTAAGTKMVFPAFEVREIYFANDRVFVLADGSLTSIDTADLSIRSEGHVFSSSLEAPPRYEFSAVPFGSELMITPVRGGSFDAELWGLDTATGEQRMVANLNPGTRASTPAHLEPLGDSLFFVADSGISGREAQVLKNDGTILPITGAEGHDLFRSGSPQVFKAVGDRILYAGLGPTDQSGSQYGLWSIATDNLSVTLLQQFNVNDTGEVRDFVIDGDFAYFVAGTGTTGAEVWVTDGTPDGTSLLADVVPGPGSSYPRGLRAGSGAVYFEAFNMEGRKLLWKSDGTPEGTHEITGLNLSLNSSDLYSMAEDRVAMNGQLYILSSGPHPEGPVLGIWRTDGTLDGTALIRDLGSASGTRRIEAVMDGVIYFSIDQDDGRGLQLWRTDGSDEGTQLVLTGMEGNRITAMSIAGQSANGLVISVRRSNDADEVWVTQGTVQTTRRLVSLSADETLRVWPGPMFGLSGHAFFTTVLAEGAEAIWATDGSTQGTRRLWVTTDEFGRLNDGGDWAYYNGAIVFSALRPSLGDELFSVSLNGDTNLDGRTDLSDLNNVRNHFGQSGNPVGDLNDSGTVDLGDLNLVRNYFGDSTQQIASVSLKNPAPFPTVKSAMRGDAALAVDLVHESNVLFHLATESKEFRFGPTKLGRAAGATFYRNSR